MCNLFFLMNILIEEDVRQVSETVNVFDKLWLQKQSLLYFDMNNCSFIGAVHAVLAYHEHLKMIAVSIKHRIL